ncbi:diaminopimelate decarboxylase, partial [Listeria monocytogenes]
DLPLPKSNAGEVLAVFCTGAYGYAMASNYNRIPRPPVVFVENGVDKLIVARETYENLVQNDLSL